MALWSVVRRNASAVTERFKRKIDVKHLLYVGIFVFLGYWFIAPVGLMFLGSFWTEPPFNFGAGSFTLENYVNTIRNPSTATIAVNTIVVAIGTTIVADFLGLGMAWVVARTNTPFRGFLRTSVIIPYMVPSYIIGIAYIFLLSPRVGLLNELIVVPITGVLPFVEGPINIYSFWGMIFVQGMTAAPLAFLIGYPTFRNFDPNLEAAARMSGAGVIRTLRTITLPMTKPAVLAVTLLIFTRSLEIFSVPVFLGFPASPPIFVFATRIYWSLSVSVIPDFGYATALASILLVIAIVGLALQRQAVGIQEKFQTITGQGFNPGRFDVGPLRWVILAFAATLVMLAIILPVAILFIVSVSSTWYGTFFFASDRVSFTLDHWIGMIATPVFFRAWVNSLILAGVGAFLGMLLASLASYFIVKVDEDESRFIANTREFLDQLTFMPTALPGIVLATGFLWFVLIVPSFGLYGSIWLLILALIVRTLPYGTRAGNSALVQVSTELEEQARLAGASWFQTFRGIVLPLISKSFIAGYMILFMSMFKNLSITVLLHSNESLVLPVLVLIANNESDFPLMAALGLVMVITLTTVYTVINLLTGVSLSFGR